MREYEQCDSAFRIDERFFERVQKDLQADIWKVPHMLRLITDIWLLRESSRSLSPFPIRHEHLSKRRKASWFWERSKKLIDKFDRVRVIDTPTHSICLYTRGICALRWHEERLISVSRSTKSHNTILKLKIRPRARRRKRHNFFIKCL